MLMLVRVLPIAIVLVACGAPAPAPSPAPIATASVAPARSATPATAESAIATPAPTSEPPPATKPAENDPQAALATAKKEGRATFVVFCAQWAAACKELEHALANGGVKKILDERYVVANVDATDDEDRATRERLKRYNVKGLPLMIVFDRKGKEVARENGYLDAQQLTRLLERTK
jgi:thiol:disulfide interchange protein